MVVRWTPSLALLALAQTPTDPIYLLCWLAMTADRTVRVWGVDDQTTDEVEWF
jgi:hypothetical protein